MQARPADTTATLAFAPTRPGAPTEASPAHDQLSEVVDGADAAQGWSAQDASDRAPAGAVVSGAGPRAELALPEECQASANHKPLTIGDKTRCITKALDRLPTVKSRIALVHGLPRPLAANVFTELVVRADRNFAKLDALRPVLQVLLERALAKGPKGQLTSTAEQTPQSLVYVGRKYGVPVRLDPPAFHIDKRPRSPTECRLFDLLIKIGELGTVQLVDAPDFTRLQEELARQRALPPGVGLFTSAELDLIQNQVARPRRVSAADADEPRVGGRPSVGTAPAKLAGHGVVNPIGAVEVDVFSDRRLGVGFQASGQYVEDSNQQPLNLGIGAFANVKLAEAMTFQLALGPGMAIDRTRLGGNARTGLVFRLPTFGVPIEVVSALGTRDGSLMIDCVLRLVLGKKPGDR